MSEKFRNKYRIKSHRKPGWDYSGNGIYFITIVTQHRICHLGNINNGVMNLSDWGKIVDDEWNQSFKIRDELFLHQWGMMPNHIHAIIELNNNDVETHGRASVHGRACQQGNSYQYGMPVRTPKSVSSFLAGFKSAVNSRIDDYIDMHHLNVTKYNRNNHFFQPNYHDHIVRDDAEYTRIRDYIINNPLNWDDDVFYAS